MRSSCAERSPVDEVESGSARVATPAAPITARSPASALALQRAAGNAAAVAALRGDTGRGGMLARCAGACTCGGKCGSPALAEEDESARLMRAAADAAAATLLARAIREREAGQPAGERLLQRAASCPTRLAPKDPIPKGWKPYFGPSWVFHCGYRGILEQRKPSPGDPMNECFYDETGRLVDENHPHAECGGSPDEYDASGDWKEKLKHAVIDKGGIVRSGFWPFVESMKYGAGKKWQAGKRWVGDKWEDVKDWTGDKWRSVKSGVGKGWRATKSGVGKGWRWVKSWF